MACHCSNASALFASLDPSRALLIDRSHHGVIESLRDDAWGSLETRWKLNSLKIPESVREVVWAATTMWQISKWRLNVWMIPAFEVLVIELIIMLMLFKSNWSQSAWKYSWVIELVTLIGAIMRLSNIIEIVIRPQSISNVVININVCLVASYKASTSSTLIGSLIKESLEILVIWNNLMLLEPVIFDIWFVYQMMSHGMVACTIRAASSWLCTDNITSVNGWEIRSRNYWLGIALRSKVSVQCTPHFSTRMYMSVRKLHYVWRRHGDRLLMCAKYITVRNTKFNSFSPLTREGWLPFESPSWYWNSTLTIFRTSIIRIVNIDNDIVVYRSWAIFPVLETLWQLNLWMNIPLSSRAYKGRFCTISWQILLLVKKWGRWLMTSLVGNIEISASLGGWWPWTLTWPMTFYACTESCTTTNIRRSQLLNLSSRLLNAQIWARISLLISTTTKSSSCMFLVLESYILMAMIITRSHATSTAHSIYSLSLVAKQTYSLLSNDNSSSF